MVSFEEAISRLDTALFRHVPSQSTPNDQVSLLALQCALRELHGAYHYLEIGSYRGGSLQTYVVDPRCVAIHSIDPRPPALPDARGETLNYRDNSAEAMLKALAQIPGADVSKIRTFDAGTDTLQAADVPVPVDLCFVDGEHTDLSVLRDARFCLQVMKPDGCIVFHDANIVYGGIAQFIHSLEAERRYFAAYNLPDSLFVVELGNGQLGETRPLSEQRNRAYVGYLWSMLENDKYRRFWNRRSVALVRTLRRRIWNPLSR